jgi:hypothetical protein
LAIKVLFFDTSALLKLFVDEPGSSLVKWLTSPDTRMQFSLHFVINEQVVKEFEKKITAFVSQGRLSSVKGEYINSQFSQFYKGQLFRVIGQSIISNIKKETSLSEVVESLSLKTGKNDWDAYHYQSIVNALAYLGGESEPILVTADGKFGKKVAGCGYRVINPITQSKSEIENIFV